MIESAHTQLSDVDAQALRDAADGTRASAVRALSKQVDGIATVINRFNAEFNPRFGNRRMSLSVYAMKLRAGVEAHLQDMNAASLRIRKGLETKDAAAMLQGIGDARRAFAGVRQAIIACADS